ncbi:hypothetical protein N7491_006636 [Penicillium cf. griseofulvum]|uniref:Uncharacterized protein n=1 Tax=Penicillium cf. griseofulvum TaxID=2972120 RepID=A0A9W9M1G5_9EURO|nr:hypothetical protein N7472_010338 [Penicillium cf. griseofulvum]KAJ5429620.1 hypothetical protein N7491_006636 [Penicillium cf. griseofulvum]KAJ5436614.1 hypothetical protein N7445_007499 [Penicillium cf. griseofulvum]
MDLPKIQISPSTRVAEIAFNGSPVQHAPSKAPPRVLPRNTSLFGGDTPSPSTTTDGTQSDQASDNIQNLAREPLLPYEIWQAIFYATLSSKLREETDFNYGDIFQDPETKKTLSNVRLVNRVWNSVATPLLFRHVQGVVGHSIGQPLAGILKISQSPYAIYVRDVRVGFVGSWLRGMDYEGYVNELSSGGLTILASRFPNLQTIRIQSPTVVNTFVKGGQIKPPALAKLTNSLVQTLRFVSIPRLKSLHITLPTTSEFSRFFYLNSYAKEFEEVFKLLEELHICINDDTGPDGRREPKWPRSVVKTMYPVGQYATYVVQLIGYTKNIKVLNLESRTWFDVSGLEAKGLTELKHFRLEGVRLKDETLNVILRKARNTLERIELFHVRLMTGTWDGVFAQGTVPSNLIWLHVDTCGYSIAGSSAQFIAWISPPFQTSFWTTNTQDWLALTHWRMVVNTNRALKGLLICPHCAVIQNSTAVALQNP